MPKTEEGDILTLEVEVRTGWADEPSHCSAIPTISGESTQIVGISGPFPEGSLLSSIIIRRAWPACPNGTKSEDWAFQANLPFFRPTHDV